MTATTARQWLEAREQDVPQRLRARMHAALIEVVPAAHGGAEAPAAPGDAAPVSAQLGEAAMRCLQAALARGTDRAGALDLLAADALLTYACEAAAGEGRGAVRRVAADYGPARLATLLPET